MSDPENAQPIIPKKIKIKLNGPYKVIGNIPLVHKTQIVSEYGEPLTWKKDGEIEVDPEEYELCRCGRSENKPFCDGSHRRVGFDGTERANTGDTSAYKMKLQSGSTLTVVLDSSLCMDSGFCGMHDIGIADLVENSSDTQARSLAIAMVERCPSGSLTYRIEPDKADIEPDYPLQIADTVEITSDGPIEGPLWVTGWIEIERADGQPFIPRNRVTLCKCGISRNKPLCDGTHRIAEQRAAHDKKRAGRA
jgi:CDGSH-type Zn-finger protein